MSENRKPYGYKLLNTLKGKNLILKLFAQNGSRFIVIASSHFLGFVFTTKRFEFSSLEDAEYYCRRVGVRKGMLKPILT
tara:strand:- start:64 stop:300 length:237 start_codon:yes stop_codon:yes gene_type:complete